MSSQIKSFQEIEVPLIAVGKAENVLSSRFFRAGAGLSRGC